MVTIPRLYSRQFESPAFLVLLTFNAIYFCYVYSTQQLPQLPHSLDPAAEYLQSLHLPHFSPSNDTAEVAEQEGVEDTTARASGKKVKPFGHKGAAAAAFALAEQGKGSCEVCVQNPEDPLCEYGLDNIRLSRSYQGSGHRVRKVMERAMRGEKIRVGIVGGSVSTGHGLAWGEKTWHARWFEDFQRQFPSAEKFDATLPASGSAFFSYCYQALIPDTLDLYLIEVDINNEYTGRTFGEDDALFRALLGLPQEPAVIRASVVATSFPDLAMGHVSSLALSTFFDVPLISIRNFLLPHFIAHPEVGKDFFAVFPDASPDYRHIAHLGHNAMADMISLYVREQVCEVKRREKQVAAPPKSVWPKNELLGTVPRLYIWEPYSKHKVAAPVHAGCSFAGSARQPLTPLPGLENTHPSWTQVDWNGKSALGSSEVGARIAFPFTGTKIAMFLYNNNGQSLPDAPNPHAPGKMRCTIDDNTRKPTILDAWYADPAARSTFHMVKEELPFGEHVLHCEILEETTSGGHEVRIMGVASQ